MPDFTFTDPGGQKYTISGPNGSTPEQAFAVLQQHLTGGGSRRDASPADWGAVPVDQPKDGPLAWGAMPVGDKRMAAPPPGFVLDQSFVLDKPIEKSAKVAQLLTSDDLSKVGAGIKILSQRPDLANSIRHADAAISSVLARGSLPATEWEH